MRSEHKTPSLKLIVFDCDGVLVDSWAATMFFYNSVCLGMGREAMTPEEENFVFVSTIPQGFARLVGQERVDEALALSAAVPLDEVVARIKPMEGVHHALGLLKQEGIILAVCTNGGAEQHHVLAGHGLDSCFRTVVTSEDVERPKPNPDGLEQIMGLSGAAARETAFVGDSDSDRKTAEAARVAFWAFANPELEAEVHIPDFKWMEQNLASLLKGIRK